MSCWCCLVGLVECFQPRNINKSQFLHRVGITHLLSSDSSSHIREEIWYAAIFKSIRGNEVSISVVGWSVEKCCRLVVFFLFFFIMCIRLYVLYTFVHFCKLCIFILMCMYSYCYVRSVLYILFSSCQLGLFSNPDWGFSMLFPQLWGKCQGISRKDGAQSALFLISELCCSMYCLCVKVYYCHRVATQLQLNIYHIISVSIYWFVTVFKFHTCERIGKYQ
jgi:hypothetical protein